MPDPRPHRWMSHRWMSRLVSRIRGDRIQFAWVDEDVAETPATPTVIDADDKIRFRAMSFDTRLDPRHDTFDVAGPAGFDERLGDLDREIAATAGRIVAPPAPERQPTGELLERLEQTLVDAGQIIPVVDAGRPGHTHTWDRLDAQGRYNWQCACGTTKCDLPRCVRHADHPMPHHIDRS